MSDNSKELSKEEFLDKYGQYLVEFSHYYDYNFHYIYNDEFLKIHVQFDIDHAKGYCLEVVPNAKVFITSLNPTKGYSLRNLNDVEYFGYEE